VLLGIDTLGWFTGIRGLGERGLNGISGGLTSVGRTITKPLATVRFMLTGPARIADLESRYAESLVKVAQKEELTAENTALRKLLGSGALTEYDYDPIKTISLTGEVVLAEGRAGGLTAGANIVDDNHVLVGKVTRVSEWTSWATLVNDRLSTIPVAIGNRGITGILKGQGDKAVVEVEQADRVFEGDRVETSGMDGQFVLGLLVGRVVAVEPESAEIYKKVWVEPLARPGEWVFWVSSQEQL
jgi:rod shape-determining protein MreC